LLDADANGFYFPAVQITDEPRFTWRGLMIDVARHFQPMEVIKRNIDGMAMVKLNVLHLHLSDDQGFRVESKKYPLLHQLGSDGQYFTQLQIKELIQYANDRGIRVIPEFDMPAHTTAWYVGYPSWHRLRTIPD
jgi:hexosaminidase